MYTVVRKNKRGTGPQFRVPIFWDTDTLVKTKRVGELQLGVQQFWDTESLYKQVFGRPGGPVPKLRDTQIIASVVPGDPRCRISKNETA